MKSKDIIKLLEEEINKARNEVEQYHKTYDYDGESRWRERLSALCQFRLKLSY